jgi:hypothetical protein
LGLLTLAFLENMRGRGGSRRAGCSVKA